VEFYSNLGLGLLHSTFFGNIFLAICEKLKYVFTFASTIEAEIAVPDISLLIGSNADVAKLVDALDLGSSAARHGGSSPSIRTVIEPSITSCFNIKQGRDWGFLVHHLFNSIHFGNYIRQAFSKSSFY
jgi:hypothetical protein